MRLLRDFNIARRSGRSTFGIPLLKCGNFLDGIGFVMLMIAVPRMVAKSFLFILNVLLCVRIAFGNPTETDSAAITSHIPRERVQSRVIVELGYSKRRHLLEIEFANGAIYRYLDVPPSVYRDLISADSKARYYDSNIKRNYRSVRVRAWVKDESAH